MLLLVLFIVLAIGYRIAMLAVSIRHEKALRLRGAVEHGAANSKRLAIAHTVFYLAAAIEGLIRRPGFDAIGAAGLVLYLFGALMLLVVVRGLGRLWTVKLLIARDHVLVTSPLFRLVRHPNYFLNILPELAGFALVLHAFAVLAAGLPLYLIPLGIRIRQEERVMRAAVPGY